MYSPRIREDLIGPIYRKAKATGVAMTTWVNQVIEAALTNEDTQGNEGAEASAVRALATEGGKRP
jgi:hypothetical protein